MVIAAAGIFAFCIHTYFLRMGYTQFNIPISKLILAALLGSPSCSSWRLFAC